MAGSGDEVVAAGESEVVTHPFLHALHRRFLHALDSKQDSFDFAVIEHLRVSGVYWALCAMELLGDGDAFPKSEIVEYTLSCFDAARGGFGGNVGHDAHLLYTLSALQVLALCDALDRIPDREAVVRFVVGLQQEDGSFCGDEWGEVDTRFSYCALCSLALLGELDKVDVKRAVSYVHACRAFDGSFGAVVGAESHAGQVFCCVAALAIGNAYLKEKGERGEGLEEEGEEEWVDRLGWWLCERQTDGGGLNGRPEKAPDVCYSWWVLSSLLVLGRDHWIDRTALVHFILRAQDDRDGGIADRPDDMADVYHTFFGTCGLTMLGYFAACGIQEGSDEGGGGGGGGEEGEDGVEKRCRTQKVNPVFALPQSLCDKLNLKASFHPPAPACDGIASVRDGWIPTAETLGLSKKHVESVQKDASTHVPPPTPPVPTPTPTTTKPATD